MENNILNEEMSKMFSLIDYNKTKTLTENNLFKATKLQQLTEQIPAGTQYVAGGVPMLSHGIPKAAKVATWMKGFPKSVTQFAKGSGGLATGVGIASYIAHETTADPGVKIASNIIGLGAAGAAIGGIGGPMGMAVGALIGGTIGAVISEWSENNQALLGGDEAWEVAMNNATWEGFNTIKIREDLEKLQIISSSQAEQIARKLRNAMHGGGTNENAIIDAIDLAPSLIDISRVHDEFGIEEGHWPSDFEGNLSQWIEDELTEGELNRFKNQLKNKPLLIYDGREINTRGEWDELLKKDIKPTPEELAALEFAKIWADYPCIIATVKDEKLVDGDTVRWLADNTQVEMKMGDAIARFSNTGKFAYKGAGYNDGKSVVKGSFSCTGEGGDEMSLEVEDEMSVVSESVRVLREQNTISFGKMTLQVGAPEEEVGGTVQNQCTWGQLLQGKGCEVKRGQKGEIVEIVQEKLEEKNHSVGKHGIDGDFGPDTEKAVIEFQEKINVSSKNGVVDRETAKALDKVTEITPPAEEEAVTVKTVKKGSELKVGDQLFIDSEDGVDVITDASGNEFRTTDEIEKDKYNKQGNFKKIKTDKEIIIFDRKTGLVKRRKDRKHPLKGILKRKKNR